MAEISLEQVLNRTEKIEHSKSYNYIEQEAINGKSSIISGNETLKKYPLDIKLHHSFCNPQKVLDEIEEKAENREIINWFQHGKYIGDYVIDNYNVNSVQKINGVIIYAEISIELLENPDSITEFEQNSKIIPEDIDMQIVSENSTKMKNFLDTVKDNLKHSAFNLVYNSVQKMDLPNLTDIKKQILNSVCSNMINEIKNSNLIKAGDIAKKYINQVSLLDSLTTEDKAIFTDIIGNLPNKLTNTAIRNIK